VLLLGRSRYRRRVIEILLWLLLTLFLLDAAIGIIFRLPTDPRRAGSSLETYFDYGRSVEGKLRRIVGANAEEDAAIVQAGWIGRECDVGTPHTPGKSDVDIYGNSFSNHIADQMERLDSNLVFHRFAGPAAPVNHSYACFLRRDEAGLKRAPLQILGVLGSSLPRMLTLGGLTTSFEAPQPFTYPRYSLTPDHHLVARWPTIRTEEDLRAGLADPAKWQSFLDELASDDAFYSEALFRGRIFDRSVVARMIRRAWAQQLVRNRTAALRATDGFAGAPEIPSVLRAILLDFANRSRTIGARPIVLLIEDRGYGGVLSSSVAPALQANGIDFIVTSTIASPNDTRNFLPDGHFTPAVDAEFARAALKLVRSAP